MGHKRELMLCVSLLFVGCAIKSTEPERPHPVQELRELSNARLRQLGEAYLEALKNSPPRSSADLQAHLQNPTEQLVSPRDLKPYHILWDVDPSRLPPDGVHRLLMWEQSADALGFRCTLLTDCKTTVYMNEPLFQQLRARGLP